jgi:hypothetical protein
VGIATEINGGTAEDVWRRMRASIGLVKCKVRIPKNCYMPPLPLKHEGKLFFPVGTFQGTFDTAELALLLEVPGARIERVYKQVWFEARACFAEFVERLWPYRDKGREDYRAGMSELAKLMMNSLFGKTLQRDLQQDVVSGGAIPTEDCKFYEPLLDQVGNPGDFHKAWKYSYNNHTAPAIGAHITSLARARLWRNAQAVLKAGGKIYYCDTDSLIVHLRGQHGRLFDAKKVPFPYSNKLGEMKLEHVIARAQFILPKTYRIECHDDCPAPEHARKGKVSLKMKGLSAGLGRRLTDVDWETLMAGKPVSRAQVLSFREALRSYGKKLTPFFTSRDRTKKINATYDKRVFLRGSSETRPLIFNVVRGENIEVTMLRVQKRKGTLNRKSHVLRSR